MAKNKKYWRFQWAEEFTVVIEGKDEKEAWKNHDQNKRRIIDSDVTWSQDGLERCDKDGDEISVDTVMKDLKFEVVSTGGNCMAYAYSFSDNKRLLVTDEGGPVLPEDLDFGGVVVGYVDDLASAGAKDHAVHFKNLTAVIDFIKTKGIRALARKVKNSR